MNWLLRHHWLALVAFVVMTSAAGWGLNYFAIDASAETLLVKDNRLYLESRQINQRFSPDEFILVAYKPHDGQLYSQRSLQDIQELSERFSTLARVGKVSSVLNVPLLDNADELTAGAEIASFTQQSRRYSAEQLREIFSDHPVYTDLLVNQDQTATAMQIIFRPDPDQQELDARILELEQLALAQELDAEEVSRLDSLREAFAVGETALRQQREQEIAFLYDSVEPYLDRADIYMGGNHVLAHHLVAIIGSDLVIFGSLITAFVAGLLLLLFRHPLWVILPLACCGASVVITAGLFGWLGFKTTVISANFIALQLILTLALAIHLIVHYQALAVDSPQASHVELLEKTLAAKVQPCFFAGLTTAIGFASLLFSGIQPVITFGWMMMVAMVVSLLASLVLFPVILSFRRQVMPAQRHDVFLQGLGMVENVVRHRKGLVTVLSLAALLVGVVGLGRLSVENSFLDYFRAGTQVRQELVFIDQEFGGSTPLDIVYTPEQHDDDLVVTAATVQMLQRIQASLEASPATGKVMSLANFTTLARQLNGKQPLTEYELNNLYLVLDDNIRSSLVGSYLDEESGQQRISVRIRDATPGLDRSRYLASLEAALQEMQVGNVVLSNLFVLYQDILQRLYQSQILTMGLVYLALGLVMMLIFRSVRIGLIALVPNILATLFILGLMGWLRIPLDLMTMTIVAIAMGIAVDDTIHFTHHYREAGRTGQADALHASLTGVGYAILMTSVIIVAGFSTLVFSDFIPSVYFGMLTALAMLVALVTDFTLLPVLLEKFGGRRIAVAG